MSPKSVDQLLAEARSRIRRFTPAETARQCPAAPWSSISAPWRSAAVREKSPGAIVIERNVLEWRLDPGSTHHLPEVTGHDQEVVIICSEGYTSSLAAATLVEMGFASAGDLEGGFQAWSAAGLPVRRDPGTVA